MLEGRLRNSDCLIFGHLLNHHLKFLGYILGWLFVTISTWPWFASVPILKSLIVVHASLILFKLNQVTCVLPDKIWWRLYDKKKFNTLFLQIKHSFIMLHGTILFMESNLSIPNVLGMIICFYEILSIIYFSCQKLLTWSKHSH